jgi:putative transposase
MPRDFGYIRSWWCCLTVCVVPWRQCRVRVSQETVRRWLHRGRLVWRRPRPVLGPKDPRRPQEAAAIRDLLSGLPPDDAAVFQDEVDLNLDLDVGCMLMAKGEQVEVATPGTSVKRYLARSMSRRIRAGALYSALMR